MVEWTALPCGRIADVDGMCIPQPAAPNAIIDHACKDAAEVVQLCLPVFALLHGGSDSDLQPAPPT